MWVIFAVESTVVGVMGCQSNKALHERIFLMHLLHPILEITVTPGQANYPLIKNEAVSYCQNWYQIQTCTPGA